MLEHPQIPRVDIGHVSERNVRKETEIQDWRIRAVHETLCACHASAKLTLHDLSQKAGITAAHLGRKFKRIMGTGFRQLTVRTRQEHAAELLERTELPIKEIAALSGYKHVPDFSTSFKRVYRISPAKYRERVKTPVTDRL
jgi:AraC-like DNA-binding protein